MPAAGCSLHQCLGYLRGQPLLVTVWVDCSSHETECGWEPPGLVVVDGADERGVVSLR